MGSFLEISLIEVASAGTTEDAASAASNGGEGDLGEVCPADTSSAASTANVEIVQAEAGVPPLQEGPGVPEATFVGVEAASAVPAVVAGTAAATAAEAAIGRSKRSPARNAKHTEPSPSQGPSL